MVPDRRLVAATLAIGMPAAVHPPPAEAATVDTHAWYVLINRNGGKAVEAQSGSTADGAGVVQHTDRAAPTSNGRRRSSSRSRG